MKKSRIVLTVVFTLFLAVSLIGCGKKESNSNKIKLGVNGTDFEVWNYVKEELAKENIELEIVSFGDYIQPNVALSEGEIDINSFQTNIYFEQFIKDRSLDLVSIGNSVIAPMAVFSEKQTDINNTPNHAKVAIPSDVTNGGRALRILETAGLIKIKEEVGLAPTINDIVENPKQLEITVVDAGQIPRSLPDIDLGVINSGVAVTAGLNPLEDSIFIEDINNESSKNYYNIFAVRKEDQDNLTLKRLVEIYQTEPVKELIQKIYKGAQVPVF